MIFNAKGDFSFELDSPRYLAVNSCGIEVLSEFDVGSRRPNGRIDYHILYIEKGICYLRASHADPSSEREWIPVPAGNVIFFRPREPQEYFFRMQDGSVSHYVHFSGKGCKELLKSLELSDLRVFSIGESLRYKEVSSRMVRAYTMKQSFWEQTCAAYLYELLSIVAKKRSLRIGNVGYIGEHRINMACRRIYENLENPPSVSDLARESCLSVSRFSHLFRDVTGQSPMEYIQIVRIERAKELLASTDLTIREISEQLNFYDQNYFSRMFKQWVRMSPLQWRKRQRLASEGRFLPPKSSE